MRTHIRTLTAVLLLAAAPIGAAMAEDTDTVARLRDALRSSTVQLRSLQDTQAANEAKAAEAAKENEALRAQVAALTKQLGEGAGKKNGPDAAAMEQALAEYNQRLAAQSENMDKWKAAYTEAANVARAKEAERAKLAGETDSLTQRATSCEAKNLALFKVSSEVLDKYAAMDIGDALGSREPFVGTKRVEIQNIVQAYKDKLLDQKATP
jgi:hypothetical protein